MNNSTTKLCYKCQRELPLSDFYKHPRNADGLQSYCKECTRLDAHESYIKLGRDRYLKKRETPEYVAKERTRSREYFHRGVGVNNTRKYIEERVGHLPKDVVLHHWNYNFPHKVFQLSRRHHARLHKLLVFDEESQCFYHDGTLILTKEEHEALIKSVMPDEPYTYFDF